MFSAISNVFKYHETVLHNKFILASSYMIELLNGNNIYINFEKINSIFPSEKLSDKLLRMNGETNITEKNTYMNMVFLIENLIGKIRDANPGNSYIYDKVSPEPVEENSENVLENDPDYQQRLQASRKQIEPEN